MRKLPWQELLTINYSSRYPLASPFLALFAVTHANDGEARGLRERPALALATYSPLHRDLGERETTRKGASGCRYREARVRRELPRIYILLRAPETDCRLLRARIFIRFPIYWRCRRDVRPT